MSKGKFFNRKDLAATMWAVPCAMFGLIISIGLSAPLSTLILSGILGATIGQIIARWRFKRNPSILEEDGPEKPHAVLKYSASILLSMCIGIFLAFDPGEESPVLIFAGAGALLAGIVAFGFLSSIIARYLEESTRD